MKEQSLRNPWDDNERFNVCIGSPGRSEEKGSWKIVWRNNDWKHSKFGKRHNIQIQETEQTINKLNPKKSTQRHIVIKVLKTKDGKKNVLKAAREKWFITSV